MSNRCPICIGLGHVLAFGACVEPLVVPCPECAGLPIIPASNEDHMRMYSVREITQLLLARPALPEAVEAIDQGA